MIIDYWYHFKTEANLLDGIIREETFFYIPS